MTRTPPDDIQIIPEKDLRTMKVVTDDVFSEGWSFEIAMGQPYLKGDQITRRGENKLLFYCSNENAGKKLLLMAMSELPDREKIIDANKLIILFLDGVPFEMPNSLVYERPKLTGKYGSNGHYWLLQTWKRSLKARAKLDLEYRRGPQYLLVLKALDWAVPKISCRIYSINVTGKHPAPRLNRLPIPQILRWQHVLRATWIANSEKEE
jgi:hypothetical protein